MRHTGHAVGNSDWVSSARLACAAVRLADYALWRILMALPSLSLFHARNVPRTSPRRSATFHRDLPQLASRVAANTLS